MSITSPPAPPTCGRSGSSCRDTPERTTAIIPQTWACSCSNTGSSRRASSAQHVASNHRKSLAGAPRAEQARWVVQNSDYVYLGESVRRAPNGSSIVAYEPGADSGAPSTGGAIVLSSKGQVSLLPADLFAVWLQKQQGE